MVALPSLGLSTTSTSSLVRCTQSLSNSNHRFEFVFFNEFKHLYGNAYRGNGHHKQFLDVKDNKIVIYPKFSFIETDNRSDLILNNGKGDELNIMWDENIDFKVFGDGTPCFGDDSLINAFYNELLND
jgi:hypothetical protein